MYVCMFAIQYFIWTFTMYFLKQSLYLYEFVDPKIKCELKLFCFLNCLSISLFMHSRKLFMF